MVQYVSGFIFHRRELSKTLIEIADDFKYKKQTFSVYLCW